MYKKLIYLLSVVLVLGLVGSVSADLVGWWRLDDGSGTTAIDSSGNGNDGTLTGDPKWVAGKVGGALEMDGGDYVDVPGASEINPESITLMNWVNFSTVDGADMERQDYLSRGDDYAFSLHEWGYRDGTDASGKISAIVTSAGGWTVLPGTTLVEPDTWYHTTLTYDSGTQMLMIYLDGEVEGEMTLTTGLEHRLGGSLTIGTYSGRDLLGKIDDIKIFDEALSEGQIKAEMSGAGFPYAFGPNPADGAIHPETWANVSWSAGDSAVTHDVYFGDDFDAVNEGAEGTFVGNQGDTFLVVGFPGFPIPDGLVPGTTYYWRIDEVNEAEPNSPWKGEIWSFMIPPKTAYFPDPADGAEGVSIDPQLSWTPGFGAKLHTVYFGETFDEVDSATGGSAQGTADYNPGTLKMAKTYYWRIDEFDVIETHKGPVWSFTTAGAVADPSPAKGAVDVTQTPVLFWTPGLGATHEIYFGTDASALELKASGNLGSESYDPGQLEWNTTYFWRVDEANNANADSPWTGPLWSFTTADFLIVDDMEAYNDLDPADPLSNRIFNAWIDGYGDPTNGSLVGYENPPFAEQNIVHSGIQSMPMSYDNSVGKSEATLTLTSNRDWTVKGVTTLTIWFRGASGNAAETLYVTLNGSARVDCDITDAATLTKWTAWNIDLQAFADQGVNLGNVDSITLGLSSVTGGTGTMYFDDIRLYPPAP